MLNFDTIFGFILPLHFFSNFEKLPANHGRAEKLQPITARDARDSGSGVSQTFFLTDPKPETFSLDAGPDFWQKELSESPSPRTPEAHWRTHGGSRRTESEAPRRSRGTPRDRARRDAPRKRRRSRRRRHPYATPPPRPKPTCGISRPARRRRRHFWAEWPANSAGQSPAVAGTPARGLQEVVPGTHRVGEDSAARRRRRSAHLCCPLPLPRSRSGCSPASARPTAAPAGIPPAEAWPTSPPTPTRSRRGRTPTSACARTRRSRRPTGPCAAPRRATSRRRPWRRRSRRTRTRSSPTKRARRSAAAPLGRSTRASASRPEAWWPSRKLQ